MESDPVIGIDLGTTNSEVAILQDGIPEVVLEDGDARLPSCVGVDESGTVIVGRQARNQWAIAPERTVLSIKRLMGSDERVSMGSEQYSPQEISAFILKALKARAERALGHEVEKAVITVPAYFTDAQRQATREAGEIAGLEVVRIINEPTAAALGYENEGLSTILVYDLGGGTFDVSVVSIEDGVVEVLASTGDNHLGGDDFDKIIAGRLNDHITNELGIEGAHEDRVLQARLRRAAETAKIKLSDQPYVMVEEDHIATVAGEARHLSCELSRSDFEDDLEELLARTMKAVTTALNDANVRPSQLDRILLVGGSTHIPYIARLLSERLGQEPHGEVDPDLCVALGAGVQAGIEMGQDMRAVLVDITPYTFGTSSVGELYGMPYAHEFIPIIRRNTKLPATRTEAFFAMSEVQEAIEIRVYQGEDRDALKNVKIGSFRIDGLNRTEEAYDQGLLFTYHLDLDGMLKVHAVERATGREIRGVIENAMGHATGEDLAASKARVHELWNGSETVGIPVPDAPDDGAIPQAVPAEIQDTLARAKRTLEHAPEEDRDEIQSLVEQLSAASTEGRNEDVATIRRNLDEVLFFLE
ncbi:MAG: Hsp70 family protein [Rhodobacteraceae bacterium]|nr:Hsp70 family protein [Paracoccaceae bacterium]MCY4141568.1 Hsp70 family protein [Paracoccaceae bacterium]